MKMLSQFILQVKRQFSSKTNSGKLVHNPTNRLHFYMLALLAISFVILLSYSQFRVHFECQGIDKLELKTLSNFCWINGTTTFDVTAKHDLELIQSFAMINKTNSISDFSKKLKYITNYIPHIGMSFDDGIYEVNHNYMRSLWIILIIMMIFSIVTLKSWSSILDKDVLRASLQLPGHEKLPVVKKAQEVKPYQVLSKLSQKNELASTEANESEKRAFNNDHHQHQQQQQQQQIELADLSKVNNMYQIIDILTGDQNEYNHTLDYYLNQLIYLLLPRQAAAYKMSGLNLRRDIINHQILSFTMTSMQFLLPASFIGNYTTYGFDFLKVWLKYTLKKLRNPRLNINSIDYELSSKIFPTSVICEYRQFGYHNTEGVNVQCTVAINEICAKLFVTIWWFTVLRLVFEAYRLSSLLLCSINNEKNCCCISRGRWPRARGDAKKLATFRYRHAVLARKQRLEFKAAEEKIKSDEVLLSKKNSTLVQMEPVSNNNPTKKMKKCGKKNSLKIELSEGERKLQEAQSERVATSGCLSKKKWYYWCFKDIGIFLTDLVRRIFGKRVATRKRDSADSKWSAFEDEEGHEEVREDSNIYYLLYLLYMRLNGSSKKIERIIKMSSHALENYLRNLDELYASRGKQMIKDLHTREVGKGKRGGDGKNNEKEETSMIKGIEKFAKEINGDGHDDGDKSSCSSVTTIVDVATK